MGVVVALHAAALLVLMKGLGVTPHLLALPPDIDAKFIPDVRPVEKPPELPPVEAQKVDIHIPIPEVAPIPSDDPPPLQAEILPPGGIEIGTETGTAEPQPTLVNVRADPRRPLSQPPYPASLMRSGTEGTVDVEVLVQPNGRVGDARIARSSGYELFDRASLDEARRNWRLLPATRNGEPYAQWYRLRVVFKITNPQ